MTPDIERARAEAQAVYDLRMWEARTIAAIARAPQAPRKPLTLWQRITRAWNRADSRTEHEVRSQINPLNHEGK